MKVLACPRCGETMAYRSPQCISCGWVKEEPGVNLTNAGGCMVVMMLLLIVSGSCSVLSYTAPHGDEEGYGFWGLVQSGIIIATMAWLAWGFSAGKSPFRKGGLLRGIAGVTLGGIGIACIWLRFASGDATYSGVTPSAGGAIVMFVSSVILIIASVAALRSR